MTAKLEADEAYFIPNLTRAVLHGEAPRVLAVRVICCSLVRPIAKIRFPSGATRWEPYETLASTPCKLEAKLASISELAADVRPPALLRSRHRQRTRRR